jgi:hypothetical protein
MLVHMIFIVAVFFVPSLLDGQTRYDASIWAKIDKENVQVIPWSTAHISGGLALDIRYNLDQADAFGGFIGIPLAHGKLSIAPYAGVIVGTELGASAQLTSVFSRGSFTAFTMNQYAWVGERGRRYRFAYHFGDYAYRGRGYTIGISEQVYRETGKDSSIDVGPAVKVMLGKGVYARAWASTNPGKRWSTQALAGVGYSH